MSIQEVTLNGIFVVVRRQEKWDTFKTRVIGHFEACPGTVKAVDYHSKEGVSHGAADHRQSWQAEARSEETKQFIKDIKRCSALANRPISDYGLIGDKLP